MRKRYIRPWVLFCAGFFSFFPLAAQSLPDSIPLRVVIIRHGEKPDSGLNLSCKGYNRSLALPAVIKKLVGVPDYTYVPVLRTGSSTNSVRMYQTIVPMAVKYRLVVNSRHNETDSTGMAVSIKEKKGTVLIVWDSKNIPPIVRSLGIRKKGLIWNPADFDSIWVIDFIRISKKKTRPVLWMTKENLLPSSICN